MYLNFWNGGIISTTENICEESIPLSIASNDLARQQIVVKQNTGRVGNDVFPYNGKTSFSHPRLFYGDYEYRHRCRMLWEKYFIEGRDPDNPNYIYYYKTETAYDGSKYVMYMCEDHDTNSLWSYNLISGNFDRVGVIQNYSSFNQRINGFVKSCEAAYKRGLTAYHNQLEHEREVRHERELERNAEEAYKLLKSDSDSSKEFVVKGRESYKKISRTSNFVSPEWAIPTENKIIVSSNSISVPGYSYDSISDIHYANNTFMRVWVDDKNERLVPMIISLDTKGNNNVTLGSIGKWFDHNGELGLHLCESRDLPMNKNMFEDVETKDALDEYNRARLAYELERCKCSLNSKMCVGDFNKECKVYSSNGVVIDSFDIEDVKDFSINSESYEYRIYMYEHEDYFTANDQIFQPMYKGNEIVGLFSVAASAHEFILKKQMESAYVKYIETMQKNS